jgi:hypothetical protein
MSEANQASGQRFFDELNKGSLGVIDELVADNFVDHEEIPGIPPTKDGVRQFFAMMRALEVNL